MNSKDEYYLCKKKKKRNPLLIFNFFFLTGLYPLIAWQTGDELVYMAEGAWNETGGIIEWAKEISNFL